MKGDQRRVLVYSHDSYGLGHLRRCLQLSRALTAADARTSVLVVTGSPRAQAFDLPPRCDTVKLPAVTKTPEGQYVPRSLGVGTDRLLQVRSGVLRSVARSFAPDLLLVDHAPVGLEGELLDTLTELRNRPRRPAFVLGLREVIDDVDRVRREWDRLGIWPVLRTTYDRVLVYGDPTVTTTADELGLGDTLDGRLRFTGYLGRPILPAQQIAGAIATNGHRPSPLILVTAGGGGDGQHLLRAYASYLCALPGPAPFHSVVLTGPFLSERRRHELAAAYRRSGQPVEVLTFTDRFEELLARAAGVVTMGGYNTVVEVLSAMTPALLVPRDAPRREQRIRAERLLGRADLELVPRGPVQPEQIGRFVRRVLAQGRLRVVPDVRLDGVANAVREITGLLKGTPARREPISGDSWERAGRSAS